MVCAGALYGWPTHNVASWRCRSHGPGACAARTADGYSAPREQPEPVARAARAGRTCSPDGREGYPDARLGEALSGRQDVHVHAPLANVPRATTNPRMGEALFGGKDLQRCSAPHVPRTIADPRMGQEPCLAATSYNVYRSARSESDHEGTLGRSPVWRADPRCSYERSLARRTPRVAARLGWSFLITP
jgi:hypothetical protein